MELSSLTQTNISLPFITATADDPKHIETTLERAKFEELCSDLLDRLKTPVKNSLRGAKLSFKDIDEVTLVGGSTRIPAVQELVKMMTGKDPNVTVNPDEVVALGAAVQAGVLAGAVSDIVLLDVTPLSSGLETLGGVMTKIIPRNNTLPTSVDVCIAMDPPVDVYVYYYQMNPRRPYSDYTEMDQYKCCLWVLVVHGKYKYMIFPNVFAHCPYLVMDIKCSML